MNICCGVRGGERWRKHGKIISSPPPFFYTSPNKREIRKQKWTGGNLTREMRARGRGRDRPDLRRSLLPCTHPCHSFFVRDRRANARRIVRGELEAECGGADEKRGGCWTRNGSTRVRRVCRGTPFLYASHFLRLNETRKRLWKEKKRKILRERADPAEGVIAVVIFAPVIFFFLPLAGFPGGDWRTRRRVAFSSSRPVLVVGGMKGRGNILHRTHTHTTHTCNMRTRVQSIAAVARFPSESPSVRNYMDAFGLHFIAL